jgi:hypothetical protein
MPRQTPPRPAHRPEERRKTSGEAAHGGAGSGRHRAIDFNALVWRTITRISSTHGGSPMCAASLDPALAPVRVDPDQMERVVRDLLARALDGLPAGASLLVETSNIPPNDAELRRQDAAEARPFVRLAVHDVRHGQALPASTAPSSFPRLTMALIRQLGGFLRRETHSDGGSSIRMYLPQAARVRPSLPAGTGEAGEEMI